jgi:hypothetical protein
MADWVGKSTTLLTPLAQAIAKYVKHGCPIYADDYAGYKDVFCVGKASEIACMAHVRCKFIDILDHPAF